LQLSQKVEQVLGVVRYHDQQRVRSDVLGLLRVIPSLVPAAGTLSNSPQPVMNLTGTIPVTFNTATYNIPVTIWITDQFPYRPPLCIVTPTSGMIIKAKHQHVDSAGMVYLPYITAWNPNCSLLGLVTEMGKVFSQDPPVRATPKQPVAQPPPVVSQQPPSFSQPIGGGGMPVIAHPPNNKQFENPSDVVLRNATMKIQERFHSFNKQIEKDIETSLAKTSVAESKVQQIDQEIKLIEDQKNAFDASIPQISDRIEEANQWLEQNDKEGKIDIDAITDPKEPTRLQLLTLVAQEYSIEDTMYQLEKALSKNVITSDVFLKTYRNLAQEQFLKKATIKKIQSMQKAVK